MAETTIIRSIEDMRSRRREKTQVRRARAGGASAPTLFGAALVARVLQPLDSRPRPAP